MAKSTDEKTVGKDESVTQQTTEQQAEEQKNLPTSAEKRTESDPEAAAEGSTVGAVVGGDTGNSEDDEDFDSSFEDFDDADWGDDEDDEDALAPLGTVVERDVEGKEYDAPYAYLTSDSLPKARTSDSDDPGVSWTAQEVTEVREGEDGEKNPVALVDVQATPGQTFRYRELPNREVAEAAGINYDQWVAGLPVRADVPNEGLRQGLPG